MWPGRPSSEAPPHLALREERAGAGGLLHADSLGRALELVLAPVRAEEVAALLVLTARHALAALDAHAADGVVRLPRNLLPLARIHRRPRDRPCSVVQPRRRPAWVAGRGAPSASSPGYGPSHRGSPSVPGWPASGRRGAPARHVRTLRACRKGSAPDASGWPPGAHS